MGGGGGTFSTIGAVGGGVFGGIIGGPMGAAAGASLGGALGGAIDQNNAGMDAAQAQENAAKAQIAEQRRQQALAMQAANPSPEEIAALQQGIALNNQDIARKQKLIDSSDPALIEAGKQALELLRGEEAKTLAPLRNQQAKERAKLEEKLRSQLGSGYANTTAGIQALSAFDEAAQNAQANAQQQSLAQLLGVAQNTSTNFGMQNNISNSGTFAQLYGNQSARMINAITGNKVDAEGGQFVGDFARAQNAAQTSKNMQGVATSIGTMIGGRMNFGGQESAGAGGGSQSGTGGSGLVSQRFA